MFFHVTQPYIQSSNEVARIHISECKYGLISVCKIEQKFPERGCLVVEKLQSAPPLDSQYADRSTADI